MKCSIGGCVGDLEDRNCLDCRYSEGLIKMPYTKEQIALMWEDFMKEQRCYNHGAVAKYDHSVAVKQRCDDFNPDCDKDLHCCPCCLNSKPTKEQVVHEDN